MSSEQSSPRASLLLVLFLALSVAVGAVVWKNRAAKEAVETEVATRRASGPQATRGSDQTAEEILAARRREAESRTFVPTLRPPSTEAAIPAAAEPAAPVVPVTPPLPASARASKELIGQLRQLQLDGGALTADRAEAWKASFEKLKQQGVDSIPAIREFLMENKDIRFGDVAGGRQLEFASARTAMFDALRSLDGPEATALMSETLQTTADPRELAILARDLEAREPGVHTAEILEAARQTLDMASKSSWNKQNDVGPLFDVLQDFGDSATIPYLDQAHSKWNYYTDMALAEMPDGTGIPRLVELAQTSTTTGARSRDEFALLLLGQLAPNSPEAKDALVQHFQAGNLSTTGWLKMAEVLGGKTIQLEQQLSNGYTQQYNQTDITRIHIEGGNQNYLMLPPTQLNPESVKARLALIDSLAASNQSQQAQDTLRRARSMLVGGGAN